MAEMKTCLMCGEPVPLGCIECPSCGKDPNGEQDPPEDNEEDDARNGI